jgi:hypothetical protein
MSLNILICGVAVKTRIDICLKLFTVLSYEDGTTQEDGHLRP